MERATAYTGPFPIPHHHNMAQVMADEGCAQPPEVSVRVSRYHDGPGGPVPHTSQSHNETRADAGQFGRQV